MVPQADWLTSHTILNTLKEPVFVVDTDRSLSYANERLATILDLSPAALQHMEWEDFADFVSDGFPAFDAAVVEVIERDSQERRVDIEMDHPSTAPVPPQLAVEARITPITSDGHGTAAVVILRDIGDRKKRERELRQFKNAVNHAGHAIFITDTEGVITYVNPTFEDMTGYTADEVSGATPAILKSGHHSGEFYANLWETILNGEIWSDEIVNERKSGERFIAHQTIAPIKDATGMIQGFVAIQDDITDQQLREQQLAVFHRVLRHNLRNEGTAIKGHADILSEALPEDASGEHLDVIQESVQALLDVSEKAHYVRQILADTLDEDVNRPLSTILDHVKSRIISSYPDAEITLQGDLSEEIETDAKVVPAVYELVENAVKHSDGSESQVIITVTTGDTEATVAIADNGPGIPEQERRVLETGTEDALNHGSGLGLWFAYWLLHYTGGDIEITVDEAGTVVTATIPLR